MTKDIRALLEPIRRVHERVRVAVVDACERLELEDLGRVASDGGEGDTIYAVDRVSEELLIEYFDREVSPHGSLVLIAEGLPSGGVLLPQGIKESDADWRVIVDPIDGTRGLMYQKRSGWILTGVAPNRGPFTGLNDINLAVQTEIPLVKQHLMDSVSGIRGEGIQAERTNRLSGARVPLRLKPSGARSIAHGFAMISRFFPGAREELAAIDDEIVRGALGPVQRGKAHCFEDQYISTGGQLFELMSGHDRFVADIRPLMEKFLKARGLSSGICAHPYDLCTEMIARELGVIITDPNGSPLTAPLSLEAEIAWVGYSNMSIRWQIEPLLHAALHRRGLV
ncbi:MAG TPA: inositol monophosphatase family protein [Blastocatellia bacterium]|nr:inositol monophosphatase family protein [Blastocatellia bacterium]